MVSMHRPWIERSGFKPWSPGSSCCVLGQDNLIASLHPGVEWVPANCLGEGGIASHNILSHFKLWKPELSAGLKM